MLLPSAYHSITARTFLSPRTDSRIRFQLRQRAWMHSQIPRTRYCARLLTRHSFPPRRYAGTIVAAGSKRIRAVLGDGRWTIHRDPFGMGPLDGIRARETAIGKMRLGQPAGDCLYPLQHRPHQAAIRAVVAGLHRNHDLLAGNRGHLHVVGGPEAAIRHLHDARLRIRRRGPRLLLLIIVFVAPVVPPLLALLGDFRPRLPGRVDPLDTLPRRPLARCLFLGWSRKATGQAPALA